MCETREKKPIFIREQSGDGKLKFHQRVVRGEGGGSHLACHSNRPGGRGGGRHPGPPMGGESRWTEGQKGAAESHGAR